MSLKENLKPQNTWPKYSETRGGGRMVLNRLSIGWNKGQREKTHTHIHTEGQLGKWRQVGEWGKAERKRVTREKVKLSARHKRHYQSIKVKQEIRSKPSWIQRRDKIPLKETPGRHMIINERWKTKGNNITKLKTKRKQSRQEHKMKPMQEFTRITTSNTKIL